GTPDGDSVFVVGVTAFPMSRVFVAERSGDGWSDWSVLGELSNFEIRAIHGTSSTNIWVGASLVGSSSWVLHWNGIDWTNVFLGPQDIISGIWAVSDQEVWVVGTNAILRATNGGWTCAHMRGRGQPFAGVPDVNF